MIKLYLFDVDGVLLDGRPLDGKPWKSTLKDDLGIDPSELKRLFFKPHWQSIVTGKKKIIPYLDDALHKMETPTTATGLLDYWFSNDGRQVSACVALLEGLHDAGKKVGLATNQEFRRADWIKKAFMGKFSEFYSSSEIGHAKPDLKFFQAILDSEGCDPSEVAFVDDSLENCNAAAEIGMQIHHFQTPDALALWLADLS